MRLELIQLTKFSMIYDSVAKLCNIVPELLDLCLPFHHHHSIENVGGSFSLKVSLQCRHTQRTSQPTMVAIWL